MTIIFQPIFSAEKNYKICPKLNSKLLSFQGNTDSGNPSSDPFINGKLQEKKPEKIESEMLPPHLNDLLYTTSKSLGNFVFEWDLF